MSKVQVDTIVDKDDISAPTLSKGAIVTGVCTATTFVGAVTGDVTGNATGLTGSPNITVTDVNATGVTTTGIATVTTSVVVGSAVTVNSSGINLAGVITATSFAGDGSALTGITQTTINNNANNLVITGSGTANTLEAESQFTYDGTNLQLKKTGSSDYNEIIQDANPSTENSTLGYLSGYWNTTRVADIRFAAGDDTSNKDNAHICFRTTNAGSGSITDRLRIGNLGQIGLPVGGVGVAATDWGTSGQVLTSGGASAVPTWADAGGGQWTLLETATSTSNVATIDTLGGANGLTQYSGTYKFFKIEFYFARSDGSSDHIGLKISTDGTSYLSSNYRCEEFWGLGGSWLGNQHSNKNRYSFSWQYTRANYLGEVYFYDPFNTTRNKMFTTRMTGYYNDGSSDFLTGMSTMSNYTDNSAVTGIQLFTDTDYGNPFQYAFYAHA